MNVGKPVMPDLLDGDIAELTRQLQQHTVYALRDDLDAEFSPA
jgi:hypothetical protein